MRQIVFTAHKKAELLDVPAPEGSLKPDEILGRTLVSLTSPGTELNSGFLGEKFPAKTGYASILEVEAVGSEVTDMKPGMMIFTNENHAEKQRAARNRVFPLPAGLKPETAVFARLMGVSMSTLNDTAVHPPARVLITGLGPIGNLAAQVFDRCGYRVTAVDPVESRRETARRSGLPDVRASLESDLVGKIALHLECSGHEQAVLDGCKSVCKHGEVVLIGVPWIKRSNLSAFDLLHVVFRRYVTVRSGSEWKVPVDPGDSCFNSLSDNYDAALSWLAAGRINVDHLATCYPPSDAQKVYLGLLEQSLPTPAAIFDWRQGL